MIINGVNNVCSSFNFGSAFYEISRGQRKKIRLFDWLGCQLLERDTNFTSNGGRRSPAVISPPIDPDGRPNYSTRSGNPFKK